MTDVLLEKLEEKTKAIMHEMQQLRAQLHHLQQENTALKAEKENYVKKLQEMLTLFHIPNQT